MKFKYKITKSVYVTLLVVAVALVSVGCLIFNVIRLVKAINADFKGMDVYNTASLVLCLILPFVCGAFIIALLANSYYKAENGKLTVRLGFLKDEYKCADIDNIIKNIKTDLLTVTFMDESTLRIIIAPADFDNFSAEVMKQNKNIAYGEIAEDDQKKK